MMNGGMLSIEWAKQHVPSILEAYYPGQLGGEAVVRTLFGTNNPGKNHTSPQHICLYIQSVSSGENARHLVHRRSDYREARYARYGYHQR
jgi:hypothetical protein